MTDPYPGRAAPIADRLPLPILTDVSIDSRSKGMPGHLPATPLGEIGERGWNIFERDLPFPVATLDIGALRANAAWINAVTGHYRVSLCPHGKTTMAPQLFRQQLLDGCWGITLSTQHQVQAARHYGIERIFLANEILDSSFLAYISREQRADAAFDFYFLVDSDEGIDALRRAAEAEAGHRPFQVLIELGHPEGRTGCRSMEEAVALAERLAQMPLCASLVGIEGFEGAIRGRDRMETEGRVEDFLQRINETAAVLEELGLFGGKEILLTAGGSSYFDLAARILNRARLKSPARVVLRSGCYITHDALMHEVEVGRALQRSPELAGLTVRPQQALTVWAVVLSRPAPDLLYLNVGKRDVSHDVHLPRLLAFWDPNGMPELAPLPGGYEAKMLYDQHTMVTCPADSPLRPGMVVRLGISHPCTTFDKWDVISLTDADLNVVGAVKTFF